MSDIPVTTAVDLLLYLPTAAFSTAISVRDTYGLELTNLTIGMPEYKDDYEELPYSNAVVDLTELGGVLPYNQRPIEATFIFRGTWEEYFAMTEGFANYVLGQKLNIVDTSDNTYFYTGRAQTFDPKHLSYYVTELKVKWICGPYKYLISDPTQMKL